MLTIFNDKESEAILLMDANNAFNNLNRQVVLHNISRTCQCLPQTVMSFVGGQCLLSQEGTTQGDPLAMAMYALATTSLISQPVIPTVNKSGMQMMMSMVGNQLQSEDGGTNL